MSYSRQCECLGTLMMGTAVRDSDEIIGLFVDAKDEAASQYFCRFGFNPLPDVPHKLFLPPATLRQGLDGP